MSGADNIAFSNDGRFFLYHWEADAGADTQTHIRLGQCGTDLVLLDLCQPEVNVRQWRFDAAEPLLHLTLERLDRIITSYRVTIELDTGLFYHHPQPRQSYGPVGDARQIARFLVEMRAPDPIDPKALPEPWLSPDARDPLGRLAPPPELIAQPPAEKEVSRISSPAAPAPLEDEPPAPGVILSWDGSWRAEIERDYDGPGRWRERVYATHQMSGAEAFSIKVMPFKSRIEFVGESAMLDATLAAATGRPPQRVRIDLESGIFWSLAPTGASSVAGFPVRYLETFLEHGPPGNVADAWGLKATGLGCGCHPAAEAHVADSSVRSAGAAQIEAVRRVAEFSAATHRADLPPSVMMAAAMAAAVASGVIEPEAAAEMLAARYPSERFRK